jgi:hypothetical protein
MNDCAAGSTFHWTNRACRKRSKRQSSRIALRGNAEGPCRHGRTCHGVKRARRPGDRTRECGLRRGNHQRGFLHNAGSGRNLDEPGRGSVARLRSANGAAAAFGGNNRETGARHSRCFCADFIGIVEVNRNLEHTLPAGDRRASPHPSAGAAVSTLRRGSGKRLSCAEQWASLSFERRPQE